MPPTADWVAGFQKLCEKSHDRQRRQEEGEETSKAQGTVTVDKAEMKDAYQCPVYKTERRFREEVFTAQLKSKHGQIKWTLSGVALFLDIC